MPWPARGALVDDPAAEWAEPARAELAALDRQGAHAVAAGALAVGAYRQARGRREAAFAAIRTTKPQTAC